MSKHELPRKVGIFLFDGADATDFTAPYEVFSAVDFAPSSNQTTLYQTARKL